MQYSLQFEKLCNLLNLGEIVQAPEALSGGLLHRMFKVETAKGRYAVKAINPQIMLRPTAMHDYINSEKIANAVSKYVSALPAKMFSRSSIQQIDNQYYLVFDWIEGMCLKTGEITADHCRKMGAILAAIHMADISELDIANTQSDNTQLIDWNYYLQKGQEEQLEWVNILADIIDNLYIWNTEANESARLLSSDMVISHRDLDPKNILWNQDNPIIIDWESAGFVNPMYDLVDTAIYWAEDGVGGIDKERFLAFMDAYKERRGTLQADWKAVLKNGFSGKLGWLEYSLKRSLRIECTDAEEQKLGTAQVTGTINAIRSYGNMVVELEKWLDAESL